MALSTIVLGLIAIFVPPLPVVLKRGCGGQLLLNLVLVLLCWFPAVIHAWWILAEDRDKSKHQRRPRSSSRGSSGSRSRRSRDEKLSHHGSYASGPPPPRQGHVHHHQPPTHAYGPSYGAGPQGRY